MNKVKSQREKTKRLKGDGVPASAAEWLPSALTIGDYLRELLPRLSAQRHVPTWPPDVFAVSMALLSKSGSYCAVLDNWPPGATNKPSNVAGWVEQIQEEGAKWRVTWPDAPPASVVTRWERVIQAFAFPVASPDFSQMVRLRGEKRI